jgi:hypothetical protein
MGSPVCAWDVPGVMTDYAVLQGLTRVRVGRTLADQRQCALIRVFGVTSRLPGWGGRTGVPVWSSRFNGTAVLTHMCGGVLGVSRAFSVSVASQ